MFTSVIRRSATNMVQHRSQSNGGAKLLWLALLLVAILPLALAACGGSSNPSTATVYLDEKEGNVNGKDTPALDKFWWSNSKTDETFTTSYSTSIAPGGTITVNNMGDDGQKITINGPSNYSDIVNVAGDATATISVPSTTGSYTFISDPVTSPVRPGARGGAMNVG